ncbi:hypothetical protein H2201_006877 [Coniosporium apollinis]|uniref:Ribosomal protein L19 n=1 Tax=Coniosporium apollinis TaxID=61459 RepID=A0ABQ9NKP3_9PEZI|nr:hypothetical protein H2201_006877 [Coniosporium apollinis]
MSPLHLRLKRRNVSSQEPLTPSPPPPPTIIPSAKVAQFHLPGCRNTLPGVVKPAHEMKRMRFVVAPPNPKKICPDPVKAVEDAQLQLLDPTGARRRLFDKSNIEAAKVGDILLVRFRPGSGQSDQFAGVCINIRRRGVDSAILLRGQLTRVGVEMWVKLFSPNVEGIEVVQRKEKRARRARLYYMRQPKHDVGSVENLVRQYQRRSQALGMGAKGRDGNSHRKKNQKKGRN